MAINIYQAKSLIFGHAIGDALGVPVEFNNRESLTKNPVTDMRGFGTHEVPAGAWSDDTSMTLCLLESLDRMGIIDYDDIMKNFVRWMDEAAFEDTDTVAAVAGGLAGLAYGYNNIPSSWLKQLLRADYIDELCRKYGVYYLNLVKIDK